MRPMALKTQGPSTVTNQTSSDYAEALRQGRHRPHPPLVAAATKVFKTVANNKVFAILSAVRRPRWVRRG
jgi:hypothetical protein